MRLSERSATPVLQAFSVARSAHASRPSMHGWLIVVLTYGRARPPQLQSSQLRMSIREMPIEISGG